MVKLKNLFIYIPIVLFILAFSCTNGVNANKIKVGFLIRGFVIDRCAIERDFFVERMTQLGGEALIADAGENEKTQVKQGIEMLDQGVDVLVIFPVNNNSSAEIVRAANVKGVPVIAYESLIENCDLDYFISADNKKGGVLMAQHLVNLVSKGNFVIIGGDRFDKNALLIKEGNYQVINPLIQNGNIKIMYDIFSNWTADDAYVEIKKVLDLTGTNPDAILCSNDGMARGIIKALEEYGLAGTIPVTGLDADLSACQYIAQGKQCVTIYKSFKKQAYAAAEMAFEIGSGKKPSQLNAEVFNGRVNVPSYLIEPIAVDQSNLKEVIIDNKVFKEEQVYGTK
jgi:D-xylose transport system substrate-binding protein